MRPLTKRIGLGLGALVGLLVLAVAVLYAVGRARATGVRDLDVPLVAASADPAAVARGAHLARTLGCTDCHGGRLEGRLFEDIPLGRIVAPNLTRGAGGVGQRYRDGDWDRAVRFSARPDGTTILPFMPSRLYHDLDDADVAALVAYLERLPPVDHVQTPTRLRLPGYLAVALADPDELWPDRLPRRPAAPPAGPTAAYGAYLAATRCVGCHGPGLRGGRHPAPEAPPAPDLAPVGQAPFDAFAQTVRSGVTPDGRRLSEWMPLPPLQSMTDDELRALHLHFQSLPPVPGPQTGTDRAAGSSHDER